MGKKKTINEAFDVQGNYCWKLLNRKRGFSKRGFKI